MTQTAYPHFQLADGRPTGETPLPSAFHARFASHFVGQRTDDGIWPPHSKHPDATRHYRAGQSALYEAKDPLAAIAAYEAALDADPVYFQAWVALSIALITDNTPESLDEACRILDALAEVPVGTDGIPVGAASIVRQNRAYLALHRWRQGEGDDWLKDADRHYAKAAALGAPARVEMLCPWAAVRLALGEPDSARNLLEEAGRSMPALIPEYVAKYPDLARIAPIPPEEPS
ncbi:MAG: hypothetical protein ACKO5K_16705 [Armatimonadota bacterium]